MVQPVKKNRFKRYGIILLAVFLLFAGVFWGGVKFRLFRPPYHAVIKSVVYFFDAPEAAYNFDVVVPGKIYRSGQPDERFIRYIKDKYHVTHIISLNGFREVHRFAKKSGIKVDSFKWSTKRLPPREELEKVQNIFKGDGTVLIHCAGGSDRTGYSVVIYRVREQGWPLDKAVEEMGGYWHKPETKPVLHRQLKELLE